MYLVGIDLGGTKIAASLAGEDGGLLATRQCPTPPGSDFAPVLGACVRLVEALFREAGLPQAQLGAVGLSCPGPLDLRAGRIIQVATAGWQDVPVRQLFQQALGVPVYLENDANAAAYAEAVAGAGRGCASVVYFTVSTGVGGGIVLDGKVLDGAHGFAAELGHITVDPRGPACPCGSRGCVQLYSSGTSIARRARQALAAGARSCLEQASQVDARAVENGVRAGDPLCREIWQDAMYRLGTAAGILNQVLDPDLFVFGGGVSNAWDLMEAPILEGARAYSYAKNAHLIRVAKASLGSLAGTTGAVLLARDLL